MKALGRGCTPGLAGFSTLCEECSVKLSAQRSITSAIVRPTFNTSAWDRYRKLTLFGCSVSDILNSFGALATSLSRREVTVNLIIKFFSNYDVTN